MPTGDRLATMSAAPCWLLARPMSPLDANGQSAEGDTTIPRGTRLVT
jgi:hypothetical protein